MTNMTVFRSIHFCHFLRLANLYGIDKMSGRSWRIKNLFKISTEKNKFTKNKYY